MRKLCRGCDKKKPVGGPNSEFAKNSSRKDGFQVYCRECHSRKIGDHFRANKDYYRKKAQTRNASIREEMRSIIREAKSRPCLDCHQPYPFYVMDFDHVRGKKEFDISSCANRNMSLQKLLVEIEKCDVVCANCHRERTFRNALVA